MSKKSVIMCVLSLLTVAYIAFAIPFTWRMAQADKLTSFRIELTGEPGPFVTAADIALEYNLDNDALRRVRRCDYDLYTLEQNLRRSDKIEDINANILTDGCLRLRVTPMKPVARCCGGTNSFYINASGKHIATDWRYPLDVPVMIGHFDSIHPPERLLPLMQYIEDNAVLKALVSSVSQAPGGDIILTTSISAPYINFGDTSMVEDKFRRIRVYFNHIFPSTREKYDTISVKWNNQLVCCLRNRTRITRNPVSIEEQTGIFEDADTSFIVNIDSLRRETY